MELQDLAQLIINSSAGTRADIVKLQGDLAAVRQEISNLKQMQQSSGGNIGFNGLGQSLERTGYNLSISVNSFAKEFKLALIWGSCIFGVSTGTVITILLVILLNGGV